MCGINGFAGPQLARERGAASDMAILERMNQRSFHRGPDEGGAVDLGFAALGMRRLSIQDIARAAQPMQSEDARFTLVYNGELYDIDGLRRGLEARGARFRTHSDTEVLLRAWMADGEDCLPQLEGMFGFAIADRRERTLWLARDFVGIKPLDYWIGPDGLLVFSSEISSLLEHPSVPRRLDHASLEQLLVDRHLADPWTLLEGVRQLLPGHVLRWRDGLVSVRRFRALGPSSPRAFASDAEAIEELRGVLEASVRSQLEADVPVGVFLSGGIDSSTVAAFAARHTAEPLQSFSVGFARKSYDESDLAREVARHLGSVHREARVEDAQFEIAMLDRLLDHLGQPLADPSAIPTWIVSRLAAEHVKVVLSGDGGDEFFGGYDHMFWAARVRKIAERAPRMLRKAGSAVLAGVAPHAPAQWADRARRARKGLELSLLDSGEQFRSMRSLWPSDELG
ncbi:MAG: asparagine synthase (glutamine-hydrolyzing), partial [Planctomycetota bacterium]